MDKAASQQFTLAGRRALVTGAARGIGLVIAQELCSLGAEVTVTDLSLEDAEKAAGQIGARAARLDVTDPDSIKAGFDVAGESGAVDILVNNAGVSVKAAFMDTTRGQMDLMYRVNVLGTFLCMQEFARQFTASNGRGKIINICSVAAKSTSALFAAYGTSKAAAYSLVQSGAKSFAQMGINVNGVAPGIVDTSLWSSMNRDSNGRLTEQADLMDRESYAKTIPLGRVAKAGDIAPVVSFLATPASDYITGELVTIDGGLTA